MTGERYFREREKERERETDLLGVMKKATPY